MQLELDGIEKRYGDEHALRDVDLVLEPGVVGLLGPNGAGKSTLMRIVTTVLQPTDGRVRWNGTDVREEPRAIRDSVGYLPEHIGDPSTVSSYGILFDDEFNGRTSLEAGWATAFTKVANYLKYNNLADIPTADITIPTEQSIDTVTEFMLEQKDDGQFRTFWSGWESAVNLLASGEVWAMGTWEPVVFALRNDQNINAQYLNPDEGWSLWGEAPWMTTGAVEQGKQDAVRSLVNWMIDGYYGAEMIKLRGYLPSSPRGIQYAEENDGYDGEFQADRHEVVRAKLQDERSIYGYNFPDPETFQYVQSQWSRLSG